MMTKPWLTSAAVLTATTALVLTIGCNPNPESKNGSSDQSAMYQPQSTSKPNGTSSDSKAPALEDAASDEHGHKNGQHGGIIVSLGADSYHVEAVVATDGQIRLFTLGKDETRVIDVEAQTLKGFAKAEGDTEAQELVFEPAPQEGDAANRTSVFAGKLPASLVGKSLDVTIPNIRIDGERFRLGFQTAQPAHAEATAMPDKVSSDAERDLYLTPGGHYTAADIEANGKMTASQKFRGLKSDHNMNPKLGDKVCPISGTKANPKFTWVIGGKPYQFCCPPCVDEFLTNAKTSQEPLPDPESFIKK